ncbi:Transposon Tn7 transposition protein TnsB [Curvibacter sp. AEP1-3]|uniref:DDE-type integrase/transposase/recombinase n=1 Tax=Curvibacter sp. AEP1-3 TaxID=1844971 RepID=UPI000B56F0D7|nr:DDE-type integrase/transposase/recombinase [Curvibacter sp. AEP1-3]ARV19525.1 Transposon Tn7 transposition protein TnsB [Curvibacter sp. AEP1-3]
MIRFAFKKGLRFKTKSNSNGFTLERVLANGSFRFEDDAGEIHVLTEMEVHKRWIEKVWEIDENSLGPSKNVFYYTAPKDLRSLAPGDQVNVKRKISYIKGALKAFSVDGKKFVSTRETLEPIIQKIASEIHDASPPKADTLWTWWKKFSPTKCILKLVESRGKRGRSADPMQKSVFDEAASEVFLTPQKMPGKAVVEAVKRKFERINEGVQAEKVSRPPSDATVYRWLKDLHNRIVSNARDGSAATEKKMRVANEGVQVDRILQRVEIDHTPLDITVICEKTRLILGRPWLTLAVDRKSRMIVGFYVSFHAPSQISILYCLRQAILPKDELLAQFPDIEGPWPAHGLIDTLVSDNGMEFHGHTIDAVALEMGMTIHYCGIAMPYMKGAIERLLGTLNRSLIHQLPGTTFSNVEEKGDYDSEKHAAIDIEVLTHLILKWIVDVYHKTPHRGLKGFTPLHVWQMEASRTVIELPAFPHQLNAMVGFEGCRTLFHYGLQYDNLNYNSPVLQALREKHQGKRPQLVLRAFEHDVSFISVFHPDLEEFVDVPAVDLAYAKGLNRYVHRMICAQTRKRFTDKWTQQQLLLVKSEIQAIVEAAVVAKKTKTRKTVASLELLDSEAVLSPRANDPLDAARVPVDTELEPDADLDADSDEVMPIFTKSERELAPI